MRTNQQIVDDLERKITAKMSANIVADLLREGFTIQEMASAMNVSPAFLHRVQKKQHSFKYDDLKRLAKLNGQTPQLLFFNSMRPVPEHLKDTFDSVREMLEVSASVDSQFRPKKAAKRRLRTKAA
jgi:hypothetical protein